MSIHEVAVSVWITNNCLNGSLATLLLSPSFEMQSIFLLLPLASKQIWEFGKATIINMNLLNRRCWLHIEISIRKFSQINYGRQLHASSRRKVNCSKWQWGISDDVCGTSRIPAELPSKITKARQVRISSYLHSLWFELHLPVPISI